MATPSEKRYIDVPYQVGPGTHPVEIHEALHAAARSNDQPMMRTALDAGADVNKKDQNGCTALHHGVMGDETVRFLLDNAANPNIRDASGGTPLHRAARYPFKGTTETLLQGGADPNIADRSGATPIIEVGNAENVDLLADYGANMNARNTKGETALHVEAQHRRTAPEVMARLAQRGVDVNATNGRGETALHVVVEKGKQEHLDVLLAHDADVNAADLAGRTPLHIAAQKKNREAAFALMDKGANPNATDLAGRTPLSINPTLINAGVEMQKGSLEQVADQAMQGPIEVAPRRQRARL